MQCPECGRETSPVTIANITVDVCKDGCGGIWFDAFELKKFDEPSEGAGEALLDYTRVPGVEVDVTQRFHCPRCTDTLLMRHLFSVKRQVVVDECPSCGGFWLDPGELRQIRSEYPSEEARRQAAGEYFDDVFGAQMAAIHGEDQARLERAQHFAHMFRFICPSYYIPGKQAGGAF